jgi:hypothetical protein
LSILQASYYIILLQRRAVGPETSPYASHIFVGYVTSMEYQRQAATKTLKHMTTYIRPRSL